MKPNTCDLSVMRGVKSNISQNSDDLKKQTNLPSISPVNSQRNQPLNLTYPPNSTSPAQPDCNRLVLNHTVVHHVARDLSLGAT